MATEAALVWTLPLPSVAGTLCTRWMPLSYLSLPYTPSPLIVALPNLQPPFSSEAANSTTYKTERACELTLIIIGTLQIQVMQLAITLKPATSSQAGSRHKRPTFKFFGFILMPPCKPYDAEGLTSNLQPFSAAARSYMRNRSPANRAASSPPVPART